MKTLKQFKTQQVLLSAAVAFSCTFGAMTAQAEDFEDVRWRTDTSNTPQQDRDGSGRTPSTRGATDNQGDFQFEISTNRTVTLQRQEFQFERRSGLHRFTGEFRISSDQPNFNRVSVAQTHDDQTGSVGVFAIYSVRSDGNSYEFGAQGDTTSAEGSPENGFSRIPTVDIELDTWYRFRTSTSSTTTDDTVEVAQLFEGNNEIWTHTFTGGGEDLQYKKVGAYRLTGGSGRIIVDWRDMEFETGR